MKPGISKSFRASSLVLLAALPALAKADQSSVVLNVNSVQMGYADGSMYAQLSATPPNPASCPNTANGSVFTPGNDVAGYKDLVMGLVLGKTTASRLVLTISSTQCKYGYPMITSLQLSQ